MEMHSIKEAAAPVTAGSDGKVKTSQGEYIMNEQKKQELDRAVKAQKEIKSLYPHSVICVSPDYIQLSDSSFLELFSEYKVLSFSEFTEELTTTYKGVPIYALRDKVKK